MKTETTPTVCPQPGVEKRKYLAIIFILAVIALAGLAFGVDVFAIRADGTPVSLYGYIWNQ